MSNYLSSPTGDAARNKNYASAQVIEIPGRFSSVGSPWSLVSDRFTVTSEYAADSYDNTQGFISDIQALIGELESYNIRDIVVDSPDVPDIDYHARPKMGALSIDNNWPANTAAKPVYDPLPDITPVDIPVLTISAPDINIPETPEAREISTPGDAPAINPVDLPASPDFLMPAVPSFSDINIPSPPTVAIPEFDSVLLDEKFPRANLSFMGGVSL